MSLIHESDAALQKLIACYERQAEQAVIVFFGDHRPHTDSFYFQMTEDSCRFYQRRGTQKIRGTVSYLGEL